MQHSQSHWKVGEIMRGQVRARSFCRNRRPVQLSEACCRTEPLAIQRGSICVCAEKFKDKKNTHTKKSIVHILDDTVDVYSMIIDID